MLNICGSLFFYSGQQNISSKNKRNFIFLCEDDDDEHDDKQLERIESS